MSEEMINALGEVDEGADDRNDYWNNEPDLMLLSKDQDLND